MSIKMNTIDEKIQLQIVCYDNLWKFDCFIINNALQNEGTYMLIINKNKPRNLMSIFTHDYTRSTSTICLHFMYEKTPFIIHVPLKRLVSNNILHFLYIYVLMLFLCKPWHSFIFKDYMVRKNIEIG